MLQQHVSLQRLVQEGANLADIDGGRLAGVAGVLLEGKAQDGYLLARDGVEHGVDDALHKPVLLVVVDGHHLHAMMNLSA